LNNLRLKPTLNINESFICKIWEGGRNFCDNLIADSGEDVEVIDRGKRNFDSGPDYSNAKIRIGDKTLTGDVEIHREYRNWTEHDHQKDRRYNSVILHVVMWDSEDKAPPKLRIKRDVPTIILSNHLKASVHDVWQEVISKPSDKFRLPCSDKRRDIDRTQVLNWLERLSRQRLELRTERISSRLGELTAQYGGNTGSITVKRKLWEQTFYEFMFEALGYSKNKEQMLKLSKFLPLERLRAVMKGDENDMIRLQSILYGTAGLLFDVRSKDDYIDKVKDNWGSIKSDLNPERLARHEWSFYGLRPQNFPTVRISYGSQLILNILKGLFKSIISEFEQPSLRPHKLHKSLTDILLPEPDEYWNSHYDFGKSSKKKNVLLGMQRIDDIIINVILPFALLYSKLFSLPEVRSNMYNIYKFLKTNPENSVLKVMKSQLLSKYEIEINSPSLEQAVIQLHNFYCTRERCDECDIGKRVTIRTGFDYKIIYY
jgi:Protein of unknown function (DUF2851)